MNSHTVDKQSTRQGVNVRLKMTFKNRKEAGTSLTWRGNLFQRFGNVANKKAVITSVDI